MNELISVIIPTYQHANTISDCIVSVLNQTYKNIEIVVVNDGSTDDTVAVLGQFKDEIKLINQENQGSNQARNRGLQEANGEFIIFCDADVILHKTMLEKMKFVLDKNVGISYVYSAFKFGWKKFYGVEFDADLLKKQNHIHTCSLVRKKDFPGFDNNIKRLQDWDVWLTMLENGKVGYLINEFLFDVQVDGKSRIGSLWLPSYIYKIPWHKIGFTPKVIKKYFDAKEIIRQKHNI